MIKRSATTTVSRTATGTSSPLSATEPRHHHTTWRHSFVSSLADDIGLPDRFSQRSETGVDSFHDEHHFLRFLAYFSGPIIWALEIATVLLIVLTHSLDFVGVIIIANLVMIVVMMVFRSGLGLWQDSHHASALEALERNGSHHIRLHAR